MSDNNDFSTEAQSIKATHKTSFSGLWAILNERKTFYRWYYIVGYCLASLFALLVFCKNKNCYSDLINLIDTTLSVFPSLCGFSLSGFAIVINMGNQDSWKDTARYDGKYSFYQHAIAVFSICVLFQVLVVISSFCIRLLDKTKINQIELPECLINLINFSTLLAVLLTAITALIMVFFLVISLFSAGQYIDSKSAIKRFAADIESRTKSGSV
ncbi:magnesium-transporting ATPase (P-type) [Filimonas zeae]|uniref:hypothetical protein n=1 Tax=Filimonas zeae TaxID=1737353 RepID=UPI00166BFEB9|nr:hypothetical protein [Filimonas zeae]MDR6340358.1 magnesium-transporting ATPase (P-type) [Filimonas zeae]